MSAYRHELCVCGGVIRAPSLQACGQFVAEHNQTAIHQAWRSWRVLSELALELIPTGRPDYIDPRRERPTTPSPGNVIEVASGGPATTPVRSGASAAAAEGRS